MYRYQFWCLYRVHMSARRRSTGDKTGQYDLLRIRINGAPGSIGTFSVQLGKYFGAEVTEVCSTTNLELVKSLGADKVIDYIQGDFTKTGQTYDIIFDSVGKSSYSRCKSSLKQRGGLSFNCLFAANYSSSVMDFKDRQQKGNDCGYRFEASKRKD